MNILCLVGFHRWEPIGRWIETAAGPMWFENRITYRCAKCGYRGVP